MEDGLELIKPSLAGYKWEGVLILVVMEDGLEQSMSSLKDRAMLS